MSVVRISEFTEKVIRRIREIPRGRVATYKQIAELAGKPQGSRGVAWILHSCSRSRGQTVEARLNQAALGICAE